LIFGLTLTVATEAFALCTAWADDWADCQSALDLDRAIRACTSTITAGRETSDSLAVAYANRGFAYDKKGDYERAIADENKAIELNPRLDIAYKNRGFAYGSRGDYDREIADDSKAIELNPAFAMAYNNRGVAYIGKGDYDRAISDENTAIKLEPQLAMAYSNRGAAYEYEKNYDQAIADESNAIKLDPHLAEAYQDRGEAYMNKDDYDQAIADETEAIRLKPDLAEAYYNRGWAYNYTDHDQAIADYDKAIEFKPAYGPAYYGRALAYAAKGENQKALSDFQAAAKLIPSNDQWHGQALARAVKLEFEDGLAASLHCRYATAFRIFKSSADQGDARSQGAVGRSYYEGKGVTQNFAEAMRWFGLAAAQGDAEAMLYLGMMYDDGDGIRQDRAAAAKWYRKAFERDLGSSAIDWLRFDADQGSLSAQFDLGLLYAKGVGVAQDYFQAYVWLSLAASQNFETAAAERDKVASLMTPARLDEAQRSTREWTPRSLMSPHALAPTALAAHENGGSETEPGPHCLDFPGIPMPPAELATGAETYYDRGKSYDDKGDYDRAITNYDKAIGLDPQYKEAYLNRGVDYGNKGDYHRKIVDETKAIELWPQYAAAYVDRGNAYDDKGDHDRAIADYDKAIKLDPQDAMAYMDRGGAYGNKGDYDREIADETEAIELKPQEPAKAYYNRGVAYGNKSDYDRAIADYNKAIGLNPQFEEAYLNLGNAHDAKGDHDKAIADETKAIELKPQDAKAYYNRGVAYGNHGDYERQIADETKAIELNPQFALAHAFRGHAYVNKGDYDKAIADETKVIELTPGYGYAYYNRAVARAATGDPAGALTDFRAAGQLIPSNDRWHDQALARVADLEKQLATAPPTSAAAARGRRLALVIGNSAYAAIGDLPNPRRDAEAIAKALTDDGFEVTRANDLKRARFIAALNQFADAAAKADWATIYFAGHGLQLDGVNYLVPVDAKLIADRDVQDEAIPLDRVISAVHGAKFGLIIVDACRKNPFLARMRFTAIARDARTRGLARVVPEGTILIEFSAREGEEALDGGPPGNSPFAAALAKRLATPGMEINMVLRQVHTDVLAATGNQQEPMFSGNFPSEDLFFRFVPPPDLSLYGSTTPPASAAPANKVRSVEPRSDPISPN
jgi:tetratricopeptide (TPR) repeat protein